LLPAFSAGLSVRDAGAAVVLLCLQVMYNHELTHGAFLLDYEVKQAIVAEMRGLLARSGSAVVGLARPVLARTLTFIGHGFGVAPGRVSMKRGGGNGR
jgi:hypothetical protein